MTAKKSNGLIDKYDTLLDGCEGLPEYIWLIAVRGTVWFSETLAREMPLGEKLRASLQGYLARKKQRPPRTLQVSA